MTSLQVFVSPTNRHRWIGTAPMFALLLMLGILQAPSAHATPYCRPCPLDCITLGLQKKDCSQINSAGGVCCVDLTSRGLDVAQAQDRAIAQASNSHTAQAAADRCPAGFTPSEQKCSPQERRNGCKDIRLPSGLGCVRR